MQGTPPPVVGGRASAAPRHGAARRHPDGPPAEVVPLPTAGSCAPRAWASMARGRCANGNGNVESSDLISKRQRQEHVHCSFVPQRNAQLPRSVAQPLPFRLCHVGTCTHLPPPPLAVLAAAAPPSAGASRAAPRASSTPAGATPLCPASSSGLPRSFCPFFALSFLSLRFGDCLASLCLASACGTRVYPPALVPPRRPWPRCRQNATPSAAKPATWCHCC